MSSNSYPCSKMSTCISQVNTDLILASCWHESVYFVIYISYTMGNLAGCHPLPELSPHFLSIVGKHFGFTVTFLYFNLCCVRIYWYFVVILVIVLDCFHLII